MTTLVTGGTGFLGRWLVKRLLGAGEDVRVLTRSFDPEFDELGVELIEGTLVDEDDLRRATRGVKRVFHLAGKVERDPSRAHEMYSVHVDGTRRLLETLQNSEGLDKIVVASTSGTVGVSDDPAFMADDFSPLAEQTVRRWPYYLSKIYAERVCDEFVRDHEMPIVQLRPALLLGPGDYRESSTGDVVLFLKRRIPSVTSGGLAFVDVRDVADAFIAAMDTAAIGEKYLLGGANMTLKKFFDELARISGVPAPSLPIPDGAALAGAKLVGSAMRLFGKRAHVDAASVQMARHYWYIDWSRAERDLGFAPRDAVVTLRDTIRWIERNHADFKTRRRAPPTEWVRPETVEWTAPNTESD